MNLKLYLLFPLMVNSDNKEKSHKSTKPKYSELNPRSNSTKPHYSEFNPVNSTTNNPQIWRRVPTASKDVKETEIYKKVQNIRLFKSSVRSAAFRDVSYAVKPKQKQQKRRKKKNRVKPTKLPKRPQSTTNIVINTVRPILPNHKYNGNASEIYHDLEAYQNHKDLQELLRVIVTANFNTNEHKCLAIITDGYYKDVFQKRFLISVAKNLSYYMVKVKEYEDLISPTYSTLKSMKQISKEGCKIYVMLLANGFQLIRLLRFSERYRMIDTRANFLMLYDTRLFYTDVHYLWKRIVNVIFVRSYRTPQDRPNQKASFELTTVPFPSSIRKILVPKRIDIWRTGKFNPNINLFADKTTDLKGQELRVVVFQHIPAVVKQANSQINQSEASVDRVNNTYSGLEVEILKALGKAMNFQPILYEVTKAWEEQWGRKQPDGSFDGLLGEIISGKADIGLGDLHYTPYHLDLIDLTLPYNTECLTFLTPEALSDNSWQTLILPFKLYMWIGVIVGLFLGGFIFYGLAQFQYFLTEAQSKETVKWKPPPQPEEIRIDRRENGSSYSSYIIPSMYYPVSVDYKTDLKPEGLYLFGELFNSFLYTYSMLLVVSLPKLPTGWSLRVLTGWYWLYCILIVVSYRASMTAILANPAPRVTIDTLQQLADSKVLCGGWGDQTKDFFQTSLDTAGQKIGQKFEIIEHPDPAVARIAKGEFAYYENAYFLKAISVKRQQQTGSKQTHKNQTFLDNLNEQGDSGEPTNGTTKKQEHQEVERNLHIMSTCVINMPISIGLQKNSPLKPRADDFLRRVIEAGLVEKWLTDLMTTVLNAENVQTEKVKALMNLKKLYGAIVMLLLGYGLSFLMFLCELIHWHFIVTRRPQFDKYRLRSYYKKKNVRQSLVKSNNKKSM